MRSWDRFAKFNWKKKYVMFYFVVRWFLLLPFFFSIEKKVRTFQVAIRWLTERYLNTAYHLQLLRHYSKPALAGQGFWDIFFWHFKNQSITKKNISKFILTLRGSDWWLYLWLSGFKWFINYSYFLSLGWWSGFVGGLDLSRCKKSKSKALCVGFLLLFAPDALFDGSKQLFDFWLLPLKNKLLKRQK